MWIINDRFFPKQETDLFVRRLLFACSEVEGIDREGVCFGFVDRSVDRPAPIVCTVGGVDEGKGKRLEWYSQAKSRFLMRNPQFLTSFEMEPINFNGEKVVLGGGLRFPNYIVAVAGARFETDEVMAYLFGCHLEHRRRGGAGFSWMRNDVEGHFGLFQDRRMTEAVMGRDVLKAVLPLFRKALRI